MHFRKIFSNELISFGKLKSHKITMPLLFEEKGNPLLTARSNVGIVNERNKYMKNWDQYTLRVLTKGCGDFPDIIGGNSCYFFIYIWPISWLIISSSITHNWNFNPSLLLKPRKHNCVINWTRSHIQQGTKMTRGPIVLRLRHSQLIYYDNSDVSVSEFTLLE